jgi:hypothetical protein
MSSGIKKIVHARGTTSVIAILVKAFIKLEKNKSVQFTLRHAPLNKKQIFVPWHLYLGAFISTKIIPLDVIMLLISRLFL